MENLDKDVFKESSEFKINNKSKEFLKTIVFWTKFISIAGLVATSFVFFNSIFSVINHDASLGQVFTLWFLSLFAFVPLSYLFKFSQKLKQTLITSDEIILQKSIQYLKSYFKTIGISMIIIFSFYFLALIGTLIYRLYNEAV